MINVQNLGKRIFQMFNFMYEVNDDYYVLGKDYFSSCTDLEMGVYKGFREALEGDSKDWSIEQYKRVRKYVTDCQSDSRAREQEIVEFVRRLSEDEVESLSGQWSLP